MPARTSRNKARKTSPFSYSGWGRTKTSAKRKVGTAVPSGYKNVSCSFENKINSYRTLHAQTKGAAKFGRPTPAILNSFANWINKGAIVQTVSCAQIARWGKTMNTKHFNAREMTTNSCKTILCKKFGKTAIKAVARTKSGSFMVATAPKVKGRTFSFPR